MKPELRITFGRTRFTEALLDGRVESSRLALRFIPVDPIPQAFRRAIRDREFDITEMALITLAMANDIGQAWKGLPIALSSRFHHDALRVKTDSPILGPADLPGRTIGVRAYSQTTAVWFRGILETDYGISPNRMRWVTTEDAHVPQFTDPDFVTRAPAGSKLQDLFNAGEIDAAIGESAVKLGDTRSVIPEPERAAAEWSARTCVRPVNHVVALRPDLIDEFPGSAAEISNLFYNSGAGRCDARSVDMALGFAWSQGLTQRRYTFTDLFEDACIKEF